MQTLIDWRKAEGHWARTRAAQARAWFEDEVRQGLLARLTRDPHLRAQLDRLGRAVESDGLSPSAAAADLLAGLGRDPG